jgi:hypothetical protein
MEYRRRKSDNVEKWRKSCLKKVAYDSIEKLRKGAERLSGHFGDRVAVHGYFCMHCGKYHLTTRDYTEEEKRRTDNLIF